MRKSSPNLSTPADDFERDSKAHNTEAAAENRSGGGANGGSGDGKKKQSRKPAPATPSLGAYLAGSLRRFVWWLLLLPLLLIGALWYWSQSADSLRQALELAQQHVPGLRFDGVSGSLWGGGEIETLRWSDDSTSVAASKVSLHWDALQLQKDRSLSISRLHAETLTVRSRATDAKPDAVTLPPSLELPIAAAVEDIAIGRLQIYVDAPPDTAAEQQPAETAEAVAEAVSAAGETAAETPPVLTLTDIRGSYHYSPEQRQHTASISHTAYRQDTLLARARLPHATLSASAPFPLALTLEAEADVYATPAAAEKAAAATADSAASHSAAPVSLAVAVTGSGELANPQLVIKGQGKGKGQGKDIQSIAADTPHSVNNSGSNGASASETDSAAGTAPQNMTLTGTASLLPLTPAVLEQAALQLRGINPAHFDASAPQAALDATVSLHPQLDTGNPNRVQAWQAQINAHNRQTGVFEDGSLPLQQLQTTLRWLPEQPERLTASDIQAQWLAGSTTGTAYLDWSSPNSPDWNGRLQLHDINPQKLTGSAPPATLSGSVTLLPADAQQPDSLLRAQLNLHNSTAGSWDSNSLPVSGISTQLTLYRQHLQLHGIQAQTGGGSISGDFSTRISQPYTWQGKLRADGINPHQLHSAIAPAQVQGSIELGNAPGSRNTTGRNTTGRNTTERNTSRDSVQFAVSLTGRLLSTPDTPSAAQPALPLLSFDRLAVNGSVSTSAPQRITLQHIDISAMDASITGSASIATEPFAFSSPALDIRAPGLTADLNGQMQETTGSGRLTATLDDAGAMQNWLERIFPNNTPGWAEALQRSRGVLSGKASLRADWNGGWQNPTLQAELRSPRLTMRPPAAATAEQTKRTGHTKHTLPVWQLADTRLDIQGTLQRANISAGSTAQLGGNSGSLQLKATAGYQNASGLLTATIDTLKATLRDAPTETAGKTDKNSSPPAADSQWHASLTRPLPLQWQNGQLEIGAGTASITAPAASATPAASAKPGKTARKASRKNSAPASTSLRWKDSRWVQGTGSAWGDIQTSGSLSGLPLRWVERVRPGTLAMAGVDTSILFDGSWNIHTSPSLQISADLQRSSGDVYMLFADELAAEISGETPSAATPSTTAGVKAAQLRIRSQGNRFDLTADWDSDNAGDVQLHVQSTLQQTADGWNWAEQTPVTGTLKMQLPQVGIWSSLAPVGWRISGGITANADISGNRSKPQLKGRFSSDNIRIYSLFDGLELEKGSLKGSFNTSGITLDRLTFSSDGGGTLTGSGSAAWAGKNQSSGFRIRFQAEADRLQISNRPDRRLSFSGKLNARGNEEKITIRGDATIDQAQIILADENAPTLDDDVTVVYADAEKNSSTPAGNSPALSKAQKKAEREALRRKHRERRERKAAQRDAPQQDIRLQTAIRLDLGDSFRLQGMGLDTFLSGKLNITSNGDAPRVTGIINTRMGEFRAYGQWLEIEKGKIRFSGRYDNPTLDITALRPRTAVDVGVQVSGPAFNPKIRLISTPDMPDTEKLSWLILGREGAEGGAESALLQQAAIALIGGGGTGKSVAQRVGLDEIGINRENGETSSVSFGKRLSRKLYLSYEKSLLDSVSTLYMFYDISRRFKIRAQTGNEQAIDLIFTLRYDDLPDAVQQLRGKPAAKPPGTAATAAKQQ